MPITISTPEPEAINSAQDFWTKIAKPDYEDFLRDTADLRAAFHAAVSLFHVIDWVEVDCKDNSKIMLGAKNRDELMAYIIKNICSEFELIRDVANSSKHFRLKIPSPEKPPKKVPSATKITSRSTSFGMGGFGKGKFGGPPQVFVEVLGCDRSLNEIAKRVYDMWDRLFQRQEW